MEKLQDCFNLTLNEFLEKLGSKSATPGGGSVAALTGAMSAALVSMVCNLTLGKESYSEFESLVSDSLSKSEKLIHDLKICAENDINAYNYVMSTFKLPKSPERTEKIQEAYKLAVNPPEETVKKCLEVIKLARNLINKSNKAAASDLYSAIFLAKSAILCALENVEINLALIKDIDYISEKRYWLANIKGEIA